MKMINKEEFNEEDVTFDIFGIKHGSTSNTNLVAKGNYLLIFTDGYSIENTFYNSLEEAQTAMTKEYNASIPADWYEAGEEMSHCGEQDAMLYDNGDEVFLWEIIRITKEEE